MDQRIERRRFGGKRAIWVAVGVGVVALAAAAVALTPRSGSLTVRTAELETAAVVRAPFQDYVPVRGEVAPLRTVYVGAVEGGQVDQVIGVDGALVAAGAPLATLSNPQLKLDVTAREAEIAGRLGDVSAQQLSLQRNRIDRDREIAETNYNLLKARRELDVRQQLHAKGFVSDAGVKTFADESAYYETRLAALRRGQAQESAISAAQAAQIRQTGARLRNNLGVVQQSLQALVVRAPVAGRLTNFALQPGQTLKAGDQVGQVDSEGAYKLTADVDEFYLGRVSPGQSATAEIADKPYRLTVSRALPQVSSGRFKTELTFVGPAPPSLRRGQTVDLRMTLGDTRPALTLPNGAWLQASGGQFAFVLDDASRRATRRAIQVGRRNPEQVEVTSGLRPGERVVTSSYGGLEKFHTLILR